MTESDIRQRINNRGWGPFFNKLWVACGLGWLADNMNIAALGLVLPLILTDLGLTRVEGGSIVSITFVGFMVGAILTGKLADIFGRRTLFVANIVLFSFLAVAIGLAQNYMTIMILRFLQGITMGGEFPIISTYLNELSPRRYQGRLMGLTSGFLSVAYATMPLVGMFLVPAFGWRGLFWSLIVPVVFTIWMRRSLPESPAFLLRKGKVEEAEAAVCLIEAGSSELPDTDSYAETSTGTARISEIACARTGILVVFWLLIFLCQYGYVSWAPTAILQAQSDIASGYLLTMILFSGMFVGYFGSAVFIAPKLTPRAFLILAYAEFGISLILFGFFSNITLMVIAGWFASVGYGLTSVSAYAYCPTQFATAIRGTGMGLVTGIGRLGAVAGPMVAGWLNPVGGFGLSFMIFGGASLIAVIVIMILESKPTPQN